jgi:hypothetical protein
LAIHISDATTFLPQHGVWACSASEDSSTTPLADDDWS